MGVIGIAVIGRNEGERLRRALRSAMATGAPVVYVDSGSRDGSVEIAHAAGATVLELGASAPFTAARARNEGFEQLSASVPGLQYVQFLDGDCELQAGWLDRAAEALERDDSLAAVCGQIREARPEAGIYHRLGALEWQRAPGEIGACGGNFMVRAAAFRSVGGFRADVIAAEDDELCFRLRRAGGKIVCLDADMALHDMAMERFGQWWQRAKRAGHAYAQGAALHGATEERHFVRDCRRIWFWGLLLPVAALGLAWPTRGVSLWLLGAYPAQVGRMYASGRRRGWSRYDALAYGAFMMLGKFPGLIGMLTYRARRALGRSMTIIEHKGRGSAT